MYIHARYSAGAAASSQPVLPPFKDFVDEVRYALANDSPLAALWDLVYLALVLLGMAAAVALVCAGAPGHRRRRAPVRRSA